MMMKNNLIDYTLLIKIISSSADTIIIVLFNLVKKNGISHT